MDPNWIMAIIAFVAIISPIVTAIINNCYQFKLKKLDMYELAKRSCLENFIENSTKYVADYLKYSEHAENYQNIELIEKFNTSLNSLYIYFEMPSDIDFKNSLSTIKHCEDISHSQINKVAITLSEQIKKK